MTDDGPPLCPLCRCVRNDRVSLHCPMAQGPGRRIRRLRAADTGFLYNCPICGSFVITRKDHDYLLGDGTRNETDAQRLSALLRERSIHEMTTAWIRLRGDEEYAELVQRDFVEPVDCVHMQTRELLARWPHKVLDKLDRTLRNLAGLSLEGGQRVSVSGRPDYGVCFASSTTEMNFHLGALAKQKLIYHDAIGFSTVVLAEGWARVDELTRGTGSSMNPVFVAMWYGGENHTDEMDELYNESIAPAAEDAGYRAGRVDGEEFNDFIMDKVLGDIRLAPFVVADFTGSRGGVYLEAGFARGLGKPVIHTCKKEDFGKAHFDIQQINTIKWKKPGDLREKLYHRIIATQGPGPYKKRET